jgi:hypothetical protein
MDVYYSSDCEDEDIAYACEDCPTSEGARVRGVFFKKNTYTFEDPTNPAEWTTAIEDGNVVIIANTHGSLADPTDNFGPGFGSQPQTYINSDYALEYFDRNLKANWAFYEGKKKSSKWAIGYITGSLVWLGDTAVTITPGAPVADNEKEGVVWKIKAAWTSENHPRPYDQPAGIFDACTMVS